MHGEEGAHATNSRGGGLNASRLCLVVMQASQLAACGDLSPPKPAVNSSSVRWAAKCCCGNNQPCTALGSAQTQQDNLPAPAACSSADRMPALCDLPRARHCGHQDGINTGISSFLLSVCRALSGISMGMLWIQPGDVHPPHATAGCVEAGRAKPRVQAAWDGSQQDHHVPDGMRRPHGSAQAVPAPAPGRQEAADALQAITSPASHLRPRRQQLFCDKAGSCVCPPAPVALISRQIA